MKIKISKDIQSYYQDFDLKILVHELSEREIESFRRPEKTRPSEWQEKEIFLPEGLSFLPGFWKNSNAAYLSSIVDAAAMINVERVVLMSAPQTGKSSVANNFVGHQIVYFPMPVLYVLPDELTSKERSSKVDLMLTHSPALRKKLTGNQNDLTETKKTLINTNIYFAWASSVAGLADKPIGIAICDEIDKYVRPSKKEASSLYLIEKRMNSYSLINTIILASTPTLESGSIFTEYLSADYRFDYHVCCPDCNGYHEMVFENFKWEKYIDSLNKERLDVCYCCPLCSSEWGEYKRDTAVEHGKWFEKESGVEIMELLSTIKGRRVSIGFRVPSWLSRFITLAKVVAAYLKTKDETNPDETQDYYNSHAALPYKPKQITHDIDKIKRLRVDRPESVVPEDTAMLIAGVDTQDASFWYEIRAFQYSSSGCRSLAIKLGQIIDWDSLKEVLFRDYYDEKGKAYPVQLILQDAMGTRTSEVYQYVEKYQPRWFPTKGEDKMNGLYSYSKINPKHFKGKALKRFLIRINVLHLKNRLASLFNVNPTDPEAWLYHSDTPDDFLRHNTVEYFDEKKGLWMCPSGKDNHLFDCTVLTLAGSLIKDVKNMRKPKPKKRESENPYTGGGSIW